jgi:hypothetical protein
MHKDDKESRAIFLFDGKNLCSSYAGNQLEQHRIYRTLPAFPRADCDNVLRAMFGSKELCNSNSTTVQAYSWAGQVVTRPILVVKFEPLGVRLLLAFTAGQLASCARF